MEQKTKVILFGSLALLTTFGIATMVHFKNQYNKILNACYTISGGVIHTLGLAKVKITLFFKVVNESTLTIEISDMVFDIYVNNMFITKITKPDAQTIYSHSDAVVQLDFEFNPKDLLRAGIANIEPILVDKEKLVIELKGTFSGKTGALKFKQFPINEKITLKELLTPSGNKKKC